MDLKKQSINGALWTFIDMLINKGAYFLTSIILAGIIGPEKFGLIGMITLFVTIGNTLIDSGMSTSLLRTKEVTDQDYSTVFVTNVLISLFVYLLIFLISPYIALFYKQPILINVIRVYSLGFIINSLRGIHNVKLIRELNFKKITILSLPGNIISICISIYLAKVGFGVWSIVGLFLVNQLISTIIFWIFIKWSPLWNFNYSNFKYHFNFGYKLALSAQLNTIFENINNILIGKFYEVKFLGYYDRAYTLNSYPASVLSGIIMKVSLPALTVIKDEKERLQDAYKVIMQIAFFISAICFAFAAILATPIITLILGKDWLYLIPMFQILTISFVFYPLHSLNINILSLFGRSDLFLKLEVIKKITMIILVTIGFKYGIYGLVWSNVIGSILALVINTYYSGRFLNYSTINQFLDLFPTILVVLITISILYFYGIITNISNPYINITSKLALGLFILISVSNYFKLMPFIQLKNLVKQHLKND
jgi:O-antigen/teichoic acid export membrane protein